MIVAFHSTTLGVRGSENALGDYAEFNEKILGNRSLVAVPASQGMEDNPTYRHWSSRFPVLSYSNRKEFSQKLREHKAEVLYTIKPGHWDGWLIPGIKNCIHAMYHTDEFHGDAFAFVSAWLSREATGREESYVPHFLRKFESRDDLRKELGIPAGARVFGRHGGAESFNISFVRRAIVRHARKNPEDHFVFLNTLPLEDSVGCPNIHYLPATVDPESKGKFFATCDATIHAQWHGETFGMAPGEFAVLGKPVMTYAGSKVRSHLELLGDRALLYSNENDLRQQLQEFQPRVVLGTGYERYADPRVVMDYFKKRFLD